MTKKPKPHAVLGHAAAGHAVDPIDILSELLHLDRKLAMPVLAGLAVFAAAAIVSSWKIDASVAATTGGWIIGFGVVLLLVKFITGNPLLKKTLSWFVACFAMVVMSLMLVSAALPSQTRLPPVYCMVHPLQDCGAVGKQVSATLPGIAEASKPPPVEADRVTSFRLQLEDPNYEEGGVRYWSWKDNYWEERYPSGKFDRFIKPSRLTLDTCAGTTAERETNGDLIFIPDKGCRTMIVRFKRGADLWGYLGQMRDVN